MARKFFCVYVNVCDVRENEMMRIAQHWINLKHFQYSHTHTQDTTSTNLYTCAGTWNMLNLALTCGPLGWYCDAVRAVECPSAKSNDWRTSKPPTQRRTNDEHIPVVAVVEVHAYWWRQPTNSYSHSTNDVCAAFNSAAFDRQLDTIRDGDGGKKESMPSAS